MKKLSEKKISELVGTPEKAIYGGMDGAETTVNKLREWAIAVVKELRRMNDLLWEEKITYDEIEKMCVEIDDPYVSLTSIVNFLIDRFEITEEELK